MRLVRFLVGAGAAAAAAYLVVGRRTDAETDWSEYPVSQDWYPAEVDEAFRQTAATAMAESAPVAPPATPVETGRFAMRGCAGAPGHAVVSGITYRRRLARPAGAEQIEIEVEAAHNVPDNGILILRDGGFAPSSDGFALMLAASAAGPFAASGTYRVHATS